MTSLKFVIEEGVVPPPLVRRLGASATLVPGPKELVKAYNSIGRGGVFCVGHVLPFLELLVKKSAGVLRSMSLLGLEALEEKHRQTLRGFFRDVIIPDPTRLIKDRSDLLEVLTADNRDDLLLGGAVDEEAQAVVLIRANLDSLVVPFDWFSSAHNTTRPSFTDLEVIDCGQTLRLGAYEAATGAILYSFDAKYRRRAKANALEQDASFGGALKRLRLEKGLARQDFPSISAKEIARIESGKIKQPHEATVKKLAKVLKVRPEEIETY